MSEKKREADFTEEEAQRRFEATLKSALKTPPKKRAGKDDTPRGGEKSPEKKDSRG